MQILQPCDRSAHLNIFKYMGRAVVLFKKREYYNTMVSCDTKVDRKCNKNRSEVSAMLSRPNKGIRLLIGRQTNAALLSSHFPLTTHFLYTPRQSHSYHDTVLIYLFVYLITRLISLLLISKQGWRYYHLEHYTLLTISFMDWP